MEPRLVEIRQDMPGFNGFIGTWVSCERYNVIFDVGPASGSERLIDSLESLGVKHLDYVFLTHVHIDHAGALADVLDHYPRGKAVCHQKAVHHLTHPADLWAGSLKALGKIAELYGPPRPVQEKRLISHTEDIALPGLKVIETPGHAPHHLSFSYKGHLFLGEAGGNYFVVNGEDYLRPATPPRLFLDTFLQSVDRLLELKDQPAYYAHFGKVESSHTILNRFLRQVNYWRELIYRQLSEGGEDFIEECVSLLLQNDPNLNAFYRMDHDSQARERFFIANSIRGFVGHLREKESLPNT